MRKGITAIPLSCMIPQNAENLLAAGRCIEAEGQALGPVRIMSTCMAVGQAAGTAAVLKIRSRLPLQQLDVKRLQEELRCQNAEIDL